MEWGVAVVVQGSAKRRAPGLVNFIPAVAYHFCLALPAVFAQPGALVSAELCAPSPKRDFLRSRLRLQSEPARKLIPLVTQKFPNASHPITAAAGPRPGTHGMTQQGGKFPNAFSIRVIIRRKGEILKRRKATG